MKQPPQEDAERCMAIRKRSKRGEYSNPDDYRYCEKMFAKYPEWYRKTEARVFNETVPFGSNVKYGG